jgi:hypothetical protein
MSERPARSRYYRPRRHISWAGIIIGLVIGLSGGLYFAWEVSPVEEFDTEPWQLRGQDQAHYLVALMIAYAHDGDLSRTVQGLQDMRLPNDPIQHVADVACNLARSGYVDSNSGLNAIRSMMQFYQGQGRRGCADELVPLEPQATEAVEVIIAPTPTSLPPPTKTAIPEAAGTPAATPIVDVNTADADTILPRTPAGIGNVTQRSFRLVRLEQFCDANISGMIEVFVRDLGGVDLPGQRIRVRWDGGESIFLTGLKPERGASYADFKMEANTGYTIDMPGMSDPSRQIIASRCVDESGTESLWSYQAVFIP